MRDNDNLCVQWLGEACGWQWANRTDESSKDCHFNFTKGKEHDPYKHLRIAEGTEQQVRADSRIARGST
jgi:ligand-binding SRPBCC domain-containing protein